MLISRTVSALAITAFLSSAASAQLAYVDQSIDSVPQSSRAVMIKASDVSPEEYARLLAEAEKVRAYNGTQNLGYTNYLSSESFQTQSSQPTIEIFDTPRSTVSYTTQVSTQSAPTTLNTTTALSSHRVVKGDTLYNLSKRYAVSLKDLKAVNGKVNNAISIGEYIQIPGQYQPYQSSIQTTPSTTTTTSAVPSTIYAGAQLVRTVEPVPMDVYAVLPGDTFYSISRQACLSVDDMTSANAGADVNALQPGQRLNLPSGHCLR